jgi:purine-binding chemotaxis protein CheW
MPRPAHQVTAAQEHKLLVFQIAEQLCAFPVSSVREILPMAELARAPGQPPLMEGFLNLRGTAIPVVRLDRLFGFPAGREPGLDTPLILLRDASPPLALMVDRVLEIAAVPPENVMPVGEAESLNACVQSEVMLKGRTIHLLSCDRMLLEKERQSLAELQEAAQRRLGELEAPTA